MSSGGEDAMGTGMRFKFDGNQPHQREAVDSVVNLFHGFTPDALGLSSRQEIVPNLPVDASLNEAWLWSNYARVIATNNETRRSAGLPPDYSVNAALEMEEGDTITGKPAKVRFPVFTVEMETGTGKTYVYLRTIHELRKRHGFRKFVVVVPSIAIHEGMIKAFDQTKAHFDAIFGNEATGLKVYDGQHITRVRSFAQSPFTEILLVTIDSFNKATNVIYKPTDRLQGDRLPIEYIQETRPILILDESQNFQSELSRRALRTLHPLLAINYSATPVKRYNLVYRLSPVDAFRHNLVKKIKVLGVTGQGGIGEPGDVPVLDAIDAFDGVLSARVRARVDAGGTMTTSSFRVRKGDDLHALTRNDALAGYIVEEIDAARGTVRFENQVEISTASGVAAKVDVFRVQIEEAIKFHIETQRALRPRRIKVLSLFFIDKVANYAGDKPVIKDLFEQAFDRLKIGDEYFATMKASEVHAGYFAKKTGDAGGFIDSFEMIKDKKKKSDAEKAAFELIMKDKERLLGFEEKTAFIFAHSALREGWDNPNVFCICTLNTSTSETRKRQEIGRGLRIARDVDGELVKDDGVNILLVVANESYEDYVNTLQREYVDAGDLPPPPPSDARHGKIHRNDAVFHGDAFRLLWSAFQQPTECILRIDTPVLVSECTRRLNQAAIAIPGASIMVTGGVFAIATCTIVLLDVDKHRARIEVCLTGTSGEPLMAASWLEPGESLDRVASIVGLKRYVISTIGGGVASPLVRFTNGVQLERGKPHAFTVDPGTQREQAERRLAASPGVQPVPNLIERVARGTGLTRATIHAIYNGLRAEMKARLFSNPEGFISVLISEIQDQVASHVTERVVYIPATARAPLDPAPFFPPVLDVPQRDLVIGTAGALYDQVPVDSRAERDFITNVLGGSVQAGDILCYFKIPASFLIHVPGSIGNQPRGFCIARMAADGIAPLPIVREVLASRADGTRLDKREARRVACMARHFKAIGVDYRVVDGAGKEHPGME